MSASIEIRMTGALHGALEQHFGAGQRQPPEPAGDQLLRAAHRKQGRPSRQVSTSGAHGTADDLPRASRASGRGDLPASHLL